jgi:hypothetical protein
MALRTIPASPTPKKLDQVSIQAQVEQLTKSAKTLNELSDLLTKEVGFVESALNRLNLGIRADVNVETLSASEDGLYSHWIRLAYGKSRSGWGFLVEELTENLNCPDADTCERWPFKESPREFRIKAVEKIPALLDALVKKASEVAADIQTTVGTAKELVANYPGAGGAR